MRKILIVDDDIMTLRILTKYLQGSYEVQTESAGYHVVERFTKLNLDAPVDMILLDVSMPIMDGITVMEELHKNGVSIPIVFLSGVSDTEIVREAMSKGAIGFVSKTCPKSELLSKLDAIFCEYSRKNGLSSGVLVLGAHEDLVNTACRNLRRAGYRSEGALSVVYAIDCLNDECDTLVIMEDMIFTPKREIYKTISQRVNKTFSVVFGEDNDTESSLVDKVGKAIG